MTPATILAALLSLPQSYLDRGETAEQRAELLRPVAEAIATVARNREEAAALIALGWHESKYSRAVLEYRCADIGPRACDRQRARGGWQLHKWCTATDVVGEARCALRQYRYGEARCRPSALSPAHGGFAALAARSCSWTGADVRVETMRRVLRRLEGR